MTKRKGPAPGSRKATPAERAAGVANLHRGQEIKRANAARAKKEGRMTGTERWARLLDGRLTVKDLDDEEVARMKVRGKDGNFNQGRAIPSHLAKAFHGEIIRRAEMELRTGIGEAVKVLKGVMDDPNAKDADKIKAATIIMDRILGKTPETVVVKTDDPWGAVTSAGLVEDRSLAEFAGDGSDFNADE